MHVDLVFGIMVGIAFIGFVAGVMFCRLFWNPCRQKEPCCCIQRVGRVCTEGLYPITELERQSREYNRKGSLGHIVYSWELPDGSILINNGKTWMIASKDAFKEMEK